MLEALIHKYEQLRVAYQKEVAQPMGEVNFREYNEIHLAAHSCAIEGNSFTIDETRELRERGLNMIPAHKSLFEVFEILDHFEAYRFVMANLDHAFDEDLLKTVNRLVTLRTLPSRFPDCIPGEYTDVDMAAGDTIFGDHKALIAQVPALMESTERALLSGKVHPLIIAARFHGFYEYLHPFRDGNGRTGRLLSNFILLRAGHPLLVIEKDDRAAYISALQMIRKERTDEHLVQFFFEVAIRRMEKALQQKAENSNLSLPTFE